ncbi:GNAT family N-acetyltransferase [Streptomyces longwoodensis]|uniref:GNAT family N-acetyltransferase n=1 Tax=Streptomyces longwoodensis TaxID=68231 RepID=UPI00368958F1
MNTIHEGGAPPVLRGNGLVLGAWDAESDADADAWWRGQADEEFLRWNTPLRPVTDLASSRESLRAKAWQTAEGTSVSFRIADAENGTVLGHVGVNMIDRVTRSGRVGYWVLPGARGRGVASRALTLAARWALGEGGLYRLELGHALGHEASCRVAERCGFPYEGTLRGAMFEAGRQDAFRDVHLHARLADDPEQP